MALSWEGPNIYQTALVACQYVCVFNHFLIEFKAIHDNKTGPVVHYVDTIRNVQVCKTDTNNLFVLTGGCLLGNLSSKIKSIGNRYGLCLPSTTRVRKIGATSVALRCRSVADGQPGHSTNVPHNKHRSAALSGHCRERAHCFSICNHDSAPDSGKQQRCGVGHVKGIYPVQGPTVSTVHCRGDSSS